MVIERWMNERRVSSAAEVKNAMSPTRWMEAKEIILGVLRNNPGLEDSACYVAPIFKRIRILAEKREIEVRTTGKLPEYRLPSSSGSGKKIKDPGLEPQIEGILNPSKA